MKAWTTLFLDTSTRSNALDAHDIQLAADTSGTAAMSSQAYADEEGRA